MKRLIALVISVLVTTACTPTEIAAYLDVTAESRTAAADRGLTPEGLHQLRVCESTDRYHIVDSTGSFRGAYQFDRSTWNAVARRWYPWLEGLDPAEVDPWWQDAMAQALWSERGPQPWPVCGRRVTAR